MSERRIALVSREVYPFGGGGIGHHVTWTAEALTELGEVTVLTSSRHRPRYEELRAAGDRRFPEGVRFEFIEEPDPADYGSYYGPFHQWSARILEDLAALYPGGGPDLVEFSDNLGEGAVCMQARRTGDPRLRNTVAAVRLNTSVELQSVLDGHMSGVLPLLFDLERYSIRYADRVIWPGGDVLGTYARYYGEAALASAERIRHVVSPSMQREPGPPPEAGPLRFLYAGRFERRKGMRELLAALLSCESEDWALTLVGGDTATAPLGLSARNQVDLAAAGDERVQLLEPVDLDGLYTLISDHHVCVVPSLWECWPYVALSAMMLNRPVLATPTGGLVEMVDRGAGWLAGGNTRSELAVELDRLLGDPSVVERAIESRAPRAAFERLTDRRSVLEGYERLLAEGASRPIRAPQRGEPLVSVVLPYFQLPEFVAEAVGSLLGQTHRHLELIVVNDGSFGRRDQGVLDEVAALDSRVTVITQQNAGPGQARNFGASQARGRHLLFFDADNVADPTLVERLLDALVNAGPEIGYVTSWNAFIGEQGDRWPEPWGGYQPIGNMCLGLKAKNVAGDATALFRRELFDSFSWSSDMLAVEDWLLYRELAAAGIHGHVIPERLFRYRKRADSISFRIGNPNQWRLMEEMDALVAEAAIRWTAEPQP